MGVFLAMPMRMLAATHRCMSVREEAMRWTSLPSVALLSGEPPTTFVNPFFSLIFGHFCFVISLLLYPPFHTRTNTHTHTHTLSHTSRTFRRITDLERNEQAGYYNQFNKKRGSRKPRAQQSSRRGSWEGGRGGDGSVGRAVRGGKSGKKT